MALNAKYLEDADRLLEARDFSQASEKYWGAAVELVKVAAEQRGWRHSSHYDLRQAVSRLAQEARDTNILELFSIAESLHANFYKNFMNEEDVKHYSQNMDELIDKLKLLVNA
jgi:hypothetical protein